MLRRLPPYRMARVAIPALGALSGDRHLVGWREAGAGPALCEARTAPGVGANGSRSETHARSPRGRTAMRSGGPGRRAPGDGTVRSERLHPAAADAE